MKNFTTRSLFLNAKPRTGRTGLSLLLMGCFLTLGSFGFAQTPGIVDLELTGTPNGGETDDRLEAGYTTVGSVVETASAWYRMGRPFMELYMPMEGGLSNALLDYSGHNHPIVLNPDTTMQPKWAATGGHNGAGAFTFDGNEYMYAGEIFPMSSSYTKTAWIKVGGDDFRNILGSVFNGVRDHHFKVNPDGTLNAGHSFGAAIVQDPVPLTDGQWYFVAVTFNYDNGEMILYKDGVEVDWGIVHDTLRDISDPAVLIGARAYAWGWKGAIDEPRIYDRALSPEQIYAMFNEGNDVIVPQETAADDRWRIYVTPFSATEAGTMQGSFALNILGPEISDLALNATSVNNHTLDDLVESHTDGPAVVESAVAWLKDGSPESVLYLPFGGGRLNALLDFSGNDNHASFTSTRTSHPTWTAGGGHDGGGAFVFDGNDYLVLGDILPVDAPYTKTAWINLSGANYRNIMSSNLHDDNNHTFKVDPDGTLAAGHSFGTAVVQDVTALNTGQWYFVALSFDFASGEMILYKDGVEVDRGTVPEAFRSVADPSVLIGAMDGLFAFQGSIDDPRIYDRVLTPEQISSLHSSGVGVMVSEETAGLDEWQVEVTPFANTEVGPTYTSNSLTVHSILVSDIPDQTIVEGASFSTIALNAYVDDEEFADGEITWTYAGNTSLTVAISPSNVATISVPDNNWYGAETITFTATNPNTDEASADAVFTVQNVNDAPILTAHGNQSIDEDNSLIGVPVMFTDPDPTDTHTLTVVSNEANVLVQNLSGSTSGSTYDLLPAANWFGTAQITVTVVDNGTGSLTDSDSYTLTVNSVNDAPVLTLVGDQSTNEDTDITGLSVAFTDADVADSHTIEVLSSDGNVTIGNLSGNTSGSTYDLVLAEHWNGSAQITVTVTDNGVGAEEGSETYTLTVNPVNDAPVLIAVGDQSTDEDTQITGLSVIFSDADPGDSHTIEVLSDEANVSVENLSGNTSGSTYDLVPAAEWSGTAEITVTVTDNGTGALSDTETFTLTVNEVNDPPVISETGDQSVDEDHPLGGIPVIFNDPEGSDTHTIKVLSGDAHVTVANQSGNVSGSTYSLIPAKNWNGTTQITVTVSQNGSELFDTEVYTFTVNPVNDAPDSIVLSNSTVDERVLQGTVVGLFSTVDVDTDDTYTYTLVPDGGLYDVGNDAFVIVGDTLKTNAELDFEVQNSYSILVRSEDAGGESTILNFTIVVNDVDETAVEDFYNHPAFNVYPVPAVDFVTVEIDNPENRELILEIYYATGALVHSEPIFSKNVVDITGFKDGMYIVRISGEQVYGTRKLIVKDR